VTHQLGDLTVRVAGGPVQRIPSQSVADLSKGRHGAAGCQMSTGESQTNRREVAEGIGGGLEGRESILSQQGLEIGLDQERGGVL
jgi:hypothetical protein